MTAPGFVSMSFMFSYCIWSRRMADSKRRTSFYLWTATAMSATVLAGFWLTYFGPLSRGTYPKVSPLVHLHGLSFFGWYALLIAQAGLIRSRRLTTHRTIGLASIVLGAIMITVGLIVSTVQVDGALGPDGDPFWGLMGLPIFSIWMLFAGFYAAAIVCRRRPAVHKRLMLLASAAALSAATFRIVVEILGFERWVAVVGTLAPVGFILAAMIHDYRTVGRVHPVHQWGGPLTVGLIGVAFFLAMTPRGEIARQGVAWVGRLLKPLY
jgi:uncharacterized membrane protein